MMAESMILHFQDATTESIHNALGLLAHPNGDFWMYPETGEEYTVILDFYRDLFSDYEPEDVQAIQNLLGKLPSLSLSIEFRRSRGNQALTDGILLALRLLEQFEGIVDDTYSDLWTKKEIEMRTLKSGKHFLDCYRQADATTT